MKKLFSMLLLAFLLVIPVSAQARCRNMGYSYGYAPTYSQGYNQTYNRAYNQGYNNQGYGSTYARSYRIGNSGVQVVVTPQQGTLQSSGYAFGANRNANTYAPANTGYYQPRQVYYQPAYTRTYNYGYTRRGW